MKKFLAGLLSVVMLLSLAGCHDEAAAPSNEPPAKDAAQVYEEARELLAGQTELTLDVKQVLTTTVEDQTYVDEVQQVLTYTGLDTDKTVISVQQQVPFDDGDEEEEEDENKDKNPTRLYTEIYAGETLYVELEDEATFSDSLTAEEAAKRFVPVVLLDAALYGSVTMEKSGELTTVKFAEPTGAEAWAMPEEAVLTEASGSSVIGADGKLQQMNYTVTYQYGSAKYTLEVESKPRAEAEKAAVPEDTDDYIAVQDVDALLMSLYALDKLDNAKVVSTDGTQLLISEAGGVVYERNVDFHMYNMDKLMTKAETSTTVAESRDSAFWTTEEIYKDGKMVITVDDGIPTSQVMKEKEMEDYVDEYRELMVIGPEYWTDVTMEDMGAAWLVEFSYNEDAGDTMQNLTCMTLFQDPTAINSVATAYETKEVTGYLGIDKYTGLVTASGLSYEGVHTIQKREYKLSMQVDQSVQMPAFGAYKAITEELQPETEPEQKATPLFYHVTGDDGQEMWLLGTIHVGDERTAFLPQEIYDALEASDALALEIDQESFEEQLETDSSLAKKVSKAYTYANGKTVEDKLDEETYALAEKFMKVSGNYDADMPYMKVSIWENAISNFYLDQGHQLHSEQGVEERLIKLAKEQEKPIREVESTLFQIQMSTGWSDELQELMLQEIMAADPKETWEDTYELYELWCAGDEAALIAEIGDETDTSDMTEEEIKLYEEYYKAMSLDRNEGMLKVAKKYLESDDVVFFAVGLAHLLDSTNGLVEALREAGYTVELVTYK